MAREKRSEKKRKIDTRAVLEKPKDLTELIELPPEAQLGQKTGPEIGRLVGFDDGSRPLITLGQNQAPIPAKTTVILSEKDVTRQVVVLFESNNVSKPIIMGLLQDKSPDDAQRAVELEMEKESGSPEVWADGRRQQIEAKDELVLRCGSASIILRRNGKVIIRGSYIESRSKGTNRIKGGSVQIN